ncbi:MAG: hypothetical protein IPK80_16355 [Nannocystis sp.]|nr:hypothetical protein [Nannocystis sp.]
MEQLTVRFVPADLQQQHPGLDVTALLVAVRALIRAHHPSPPADDPVDGPAVEEVVIRGLARRRDRGWRVELGYLRDPHPNSRYDKSSCAAGELLLAEDGRVIRGRLSRLSRG